MTDDLPESLIDLRLLDLRPKTFRPETRKIIKITSVGQEPIKDIKINN